MILIVDDKEENLFALKKVLEVKGFQVETASSGEEALKKVLKNIYALIILDVQMPGMDGFEVAEAISGYGKTKDTPIIFLSAVNTEKRFITKGYMSGGIDYVVKPFDPDILLLKVTTFIRLYEQTRELNHIQKTLREEIEYRKQAEIDLLHSNAELRSILESIPQIAFTAEADGTVEYVNEHWYRYSLSREQFPRTMPNSETVATCMQTAISTRQPLVREINIRTLLQPTGRFHLLSITPVRESNRIVKWVGIFTDIHEQKVLTEVLEKKVEERTTALSEMNDQLKASNNELQQFNSIACHDLQEPLRKIQVFSHLVRGKFLQENDQATGYIDRIIDSSFRMRNLINDLLSYSGVTASAPFKTTDLNALVDETLEDLELLINDKNARIEITPLPEVEAVPGQLRHVFINLISNALKFSRQGVPPIVRITGDLVAEKSAFATADPNGDYCRITISDNGIGFNELYLNKIFTIFQRLHSKEEYEGTGIGLAIAKRVIENHSGLITATSIEQQGATFILLLPVHQVKTKVFV